MTKKPSETHPNATAFPPGTSGPALRALASAGIRSMDDLVQRNGQLCRAAAMTNGRCRGHGGRTPSGPASPHWKAGKHSRVLRDLGLSERYDALRTHPELAELRDEVALAGPGGAAGQTTVALRMEGSVNRPSLVPVPELYRWRKTSYGNSSAWST